MQQWICSGMCGVVGLLLTFGALLAMLDDLRTRAAVLSGNVQPIAELREGTVLTRGKLFCDHPLEAPLGLGPVIAFRFWVSELRVLPKPRRRTIVDDTQVAVGTTVEDATGSIPVKLDKQSLIVDTRAADGNSSVLSEPPPGLAEAMAPYERSTTGLFLNRTLHWTVDTVPLGDEVTVIGTAKRGDDGKLAIVDKVRAARGTPLALAQKLQTSMLTNGGLMLLFGGLTVAGIVAIWTHK
jgi:hypothetical protein